MHISEEYMSRIINVDFLNEHCTEIYSTWEPLPKWLHHLIEFDPERKTARLRNGKLVEDQGFRITSTYEKRINTRKFFDLEESMSEEESELLYDMGNLDYYTFFKLIEEHPEFTDLIKPEYRDKKNELLSEVITRRSFVL